MRTLMATFGLLAILACPTGQALAFEQMAPAPSVPDGSQAAPGLQGVPADPARPAPPAPGGQGQIAPSLESEEGKGVKIPGLGSFNFLPKLDFGLELMYGDQPKANSPVDPVPDQDVMIRGTVKKRF